MVAAARRGRPAWTQATGSSELWDFLLASWLSIPIPGLVLPEWPPGLSTSLPLASTSCLYGIKIYFQGRDLGTGGQCILEAKKALLRWGWNQLSYRSQAWSYGYFTTLQMLPEAVTIVLLSKKEARTRRGQAACLVTRCLSFMLIFKFKFN